MKTATFIAISLVAVFSAFAGAIMEYECAECGYVAEDMFIGGGKTPGAFYVLAYCPECDEFRTARELEEGGIEGECRDCGEALEPCDGENWTRYEEDEWVYKCPKCGEFAIEMRRVGLWD